MSSKILFRDVIAVFISSAVVVACCFYGPSVHLPFLMGILTGILLGWLQPYKGWILAIGQILLVAIFYFLVHQLQLLKSFDPDATRFTALLQFMPVFVGSYIGGFFKRALK